MLVFLSNFLFDCVMVRTVERCRLKDAGDYDLFDVTFVQVMWLWMVQL